MSNQISLQISFAPTGDEFGGEGEVGEVFGDWLKRLFQVRFTLCRRFRGVIKIESRDSIYVGRFALRIDA